MASPAHSFTRRLSRALHRGLKWNWVYWPAVIQHGPSEVLVAAIPQRVVQAVEKGEMSQRQAALLLASHNGTTLETFTPYVPVWQEALALLLAMRVDSRQAALLGQTAYDLARAGNWADAFEAVWSAASIERAYAGRVVKWRPLLYLIAQGLLRSGHDTAGNDPRVRSATEAAPGVLRARHAGRGRHQ